MRRKAIQLASKTLVISLPSKWAKMHGIKRGDEIEVEEAGNVLKVHASSGKRSMQSTVKIRAGHPFMRRVIDTPYRMGLDEIRIEYDEPSVFPKIQAEINNLMGFEIMRQGPGYCVARNIAEGIDAEFVNSFNRLFFVTISFLEDILCAIEKKEPDSLKDIMGSEDITNRLAHFCRRMLNIEKVPDSIRSRSSYRVVCLLEEIGDIAKKMCMFLADKGIKPKTDTSRYLGKAIEQLRMSQSLYSRFSSGALVGYGALEKSNEKKGYILSANRSADAYAVFCISMIVEKTKHISEEAFGQLSG